MDQKFTCLSHRKAEVIVVPVMLVCALSLKDAIK